MEYRWPTLGSLRLDVGGSDHLGPLLGFIGDQLAEVSGRAGHCRASQVSEPRLDLGIGESRVNLLAEHIDDLGGRAPRNADAEPITRLVTRQGLAHSRYFR